MTLTAVTSNERNGAGYVAVRGMRRVSSHAAVMLLVPVNVQVVHCALAFFMRVFFFIGAETARLVRGMVEAVRLIDKVAGRNLTALWL